MLAHLAILGLLLGSTGEAGDVGSIPAAWGEFQDAGRVGLGFFAEAGLFDGSPGGAFGPDVMVAISPNFELLLAGAFALSRRRSDQPPDEHPRALLLSPRVRWLSSRGNSPLLYLEAGSHLGLFFNELRDVTGATVGYDAFELNVGAMAGAGVLWRFGRWLRGGGFVNCGFDRIIRQGFTLHLTAGARAELVY